MHTLAAASVDDGLIDVTNGGFVGEPEVAFGVANAIQHVSGFVNAFA